MDYNYENLLVSKEVSMKDRRKCKRQNFSYYMRITDSVTQEPIGHLSDISQVGFKLDSPKPLPIGVGFNLRIDLTNEIADKNFLAFVARSKWCSSDRTDPFIQNVGFEIVNMKPQDLAIYERIVERYASKTTKIFAGI
jgi:PilZ domain